MRPRITNIATQTFDVRRFSFESAGALAREQYGGGGYELLEWSREVRDADAAG